ncbi:MAG: MFS transporter [Candidatus Gastranaerophilales bacterium]|nr:MFS transporter [Candidatus Gastranaerophilales bacterium]MCM1072727.1 MFS transporter [Bacteroides sp.]
MEENALKKFNTAKLISFAIGFFGLQFAWQMRIILSGPVTESLGASPFLFGLIWLAGPFTGMVVQPLIGALSDKTTSPFGRRRPYLLGGALLSALALWALPNSEAITNFISSSLHIKFPALAALAFAAIMIWILDACVNIAQGPYRALVPDVVPQEQHSIANSYISLAIGLGSVVAAATAPFLKWAFNYQMSVNAQFIMAALAFTLGMIWTCMAIKERRYEPKEDDKTEKFDFVKSLKEFFALSPEVGKICWMQFFTWIGNMCMMIYFTQYAIHTVYGVPDLSGVNEAVKASFEGAVLAGTNFSSICFAIFNLVCFLVAIPIGVLSVKFGNKKVHIISMISMALAFLGMAFTKDHTTVAVLMGLSGIGWASICALPFAMLSQYIKPGTEGSVMGIFNIFIAGPQVFVCTLVSWIINKCVFSVDAGVNYHWEYTFLIGAFCLAAASLIASRVKEIRA